MRQTAVPVFSWGENFSRYEKIIAIRRCLHAADCDSRKIACRVRRLQIFAGEQHDEILCQACPPIRRLHFLDHWRVCVGNFARRGSLGAQKKKRDGDEQNRCGRMPSLSAQARGMAIDRNLSICLLRHNNGASNGGAGVSPARSFYFKDCARNGQMERSCSCGVSRDGRNKPAPLRRRRQRPSQRRKTQCYTGPPPRRTGP